MRQKQLDRQKVNHLFTCFLPDVLYEQSLAGISNTGIDYRDTYLRGELRRFRAQTFDYLNSKKAFSELFFTRLPKEQWKENWDDYSSSEKETYGSTYKQLENYPRLSFTDAPEFIAGQSLSFPNNIPVLLGVNLLLFFIGLGLFQTIKR